MIWNNQTPEATLASATGEDTTPLYTDVPSEVFESTETHIEITATFSQPVSITGAALVNYNTFQGTIVLQCSNDGFLTIEEFTISLNPGTAFSIQLGGLLYSEFRFVIDRNAERDPTFKLGQIYLGAFYEFPDRITFPLNIVPVSVINRLTSRVGQSFTEKVSEYRQIEINFAGVSLNDYEVIKGNLDWDGQSKILILSTQAYQGEKEKDFGCKIQQGGCSFKVDFKTNPFEVGNV
ncbi:MAG: hypothetical protein GY765_02850 [bacterium]|nr:hypothetical protein [bacterium]